jgi:hypothetical protein
MYGTIADWRTYATARGNNAPTEAADADATAALVRASDYIKYRYVANLLPGYDETLDVVEYATYEAALLELETSGFFTKTYTEADRKVLTEVKGVKWTVIGKAGSVYANSPAVSLIEAMFEPYISQREGPYAFMQSIGGAA